MATGEQESFRARASARDRITLLRHAYGLLLALITISLAFQLAAPDGGWARLVTIALQGATLLLALHASGISRLLTRIAAGFVIAAMVGAAGLSIGVSDIRLEAGRGLLLMLAALAPTAIAIGVVHEVRERSRVTIRAMFGGLCIYLLLGMLFAFAYGVVAAIDADPFFAAGDAETQANFLYFGFATQTTTGYGDLTAATGLGRSLAITQALVGQIYLVTVVALIVGNLGRPRGSIR